MMVRTLPDGDSAHVAVVMVRAWAGDDSDGEGAKVGRSAIVQVREQEKGARSGDENAGEGTGSGLETEGRIRGDPYVGLTRWHFDTIISWSPAALHHPRSLSMPRYHLQ
jgi:hypothetical protein